MFCPLSGDVFLPCSCLCCPWSEQIHSYWRQRRGEHAVCSIFSQISARRRDALAIQQRQAEADREPAWNRPSIDLTAMDALETAAMETGHVGHNGEPQTAMTLLTAG